MRLLETAQDNPQEQEEIFAGVQRLVDPEGMGSIYKVRSITCQPPECGAKEALIPTAFESISN